MTNRSTRREFVKALAAGGTLCGASPFLAGGRGSPCQATDLTPVAPQVALDGTAVEAEMRRRAKSHLPQRRLVVDYYRIGRRLAYPLPVTSLLVPDVPVPGIAGYPWDTWMSWALEERILVLGWVAEWFRDEEARNAAAADLAALAQWPQYGRAGPNLSSAHAGRILWTASTRWRWVGNDLRRTLREACRRHVDASLPASDKALADVRTKEDVLRRNSPHGLLHNIGLIWNAGAALAAVAGEHRAASVLSGRLLALFGAVLDLRTKGFSEGVAYDGYVLDFIADWLGTLPAKERSPILDYPRIEDYLDQSYMLSAPGAAEQVAEIGDVEPREMPFHLSAQAKLLALRGNPTRAWHLARSPLGCFRADGLAALRSAPNSPSGSAPPAGALDAHYAAVLRTGWEADDVAVAISCTDSPMGHLPSDNGTLILGTRGRWLIADPGYQQYAPGAEREFTIGPTAHNAPLINGTAQTQKRPRRLILEEVGHNLRHVAIDLTRCYPASVPLTTVVRHVWLSGKNLVVVADRLKGRQPLQATYHWHGHPACAWWVEANWALLTLDGVQLGLTCPQARLSVANLHRLAGSRGQLSLVCPLEQPGSVVWWAFVFGNDRPVLRPSPDARQLQILDQTFAV